MTAAEALDPDDQTRCGCARPFADLVAVLDGKEHAVRPADRAGGLDSMFWAYCRRCRARYPGHWRVSAPPPGPVPTWPDPPAKQEPLW